MIIGNNRTFQERQRHTNHNASFLFESRRVNDKKKVRRPLRMYTHNNTLATTSSRSMAEYRIIADL